MIFNSLTYFLLLFVVVILFWLLPYRLRLFLVFISSLIFYGFWRIDFIPVMLFSVLVDYFIAIQIPKSSLKGRKRLLLTSILINLGLLFYFKYLIFFSGNAIGLMNLLGADIDPLVLNIILPLGISFYTFQTISYTVDVYREKTQPERDFMLYACYITFFPQLIAGPVLRASEVIYQFAQRQMFSWSDIIIGLRRIVYGLFLKVVLADNIATLVDTGFLIPLDAMSALDVWTLAFLFGFQIYFDFCAYSHIALGSARLLGIKFPENFNFPYLAVSPSDFWKRWHISLSSWIRDYLYSPLVGTLAQGRSVGGLSEINTGQRRTVALFSTWMIMGLWHGANWTFVLWGLYHAIILYICRIFSPITNSFNSSVKLVGGVFFTLPIMMLSWIPFRAETFGNAIDMWAKIFNPYLYDSLGMRENSYLAAIIILLGVFITYWVKFKLIPSMNPFSRWLFFAQILTFTIMFSLIIIFFRPVNQFIYFQF